MAEVRISVISSRVTGASTSGGHVIFHELLLQLLLLLPLSGDLPFLLTFHDMHAALQLLLLLIKIN